MEEIPIKKWFSTDFSVEVHLNWELLDLTDYTAKFLMIAKDKTIKTEVDVTIIKPTEWVLYYTPTATDVDTIWEYKAYFALSLAWVKKLSAPTDHFIVDIIDDK